MAETLITHPIDTNNNTFSGQEIGTSDTLIGHPNSDYSIMADLVYPSDLQDSVRKMNYMVFHINVNQDSKFVRNPQSLKDVVARKGTSRISETISEPLKRGVSALGELANSQLFDLAQKYPDNAQFFYDMQSGTNTVTDFLKKAVTTKPLKRLAGSIMLYMPINVGASYGVNYSSGEMGMIGSLAAAAQNKEALEAAMKSSGMVLGRLGAKITASGIENVANSIGLDANTLGNFNSAINAATRKVFNPRKEQLFQDVQFRQFTYHFDFAPRTQSECDTVVKIINAFKFHMHPELDPSYYFYMYPSEFDIEYHIHGEGENDYMNKISSCVLENMEIQYGPGTNWSTLINGCPSQLHINLHFVEIVPLNKNMIREGGY